ncbi:MAG: hypothetical protein QXQ31_06940 [Zestosphaera sp.]
MLLVIYRLSSERQADGLRYSVNVVEGREVVGGWRVREVIVDGRELESVGVITCVDATKMTIREDGTAVISTKVVRDE